MVALHQLEQWLLGLSGQIALPWFVIIGAMVEEIIAPIPSPIIMTLAGSLAKAQEQSWIYLIFLALFGGTAKAAASWLVYMAADKGEDVILGRFGKYLGVSSAEVEGIGQYFKGGLKDVGIIFLARAIPIIPTAPVSLVCGIIKIDLRSYITGTWAGNVVRSMLYLGLGHAGLTSLESILSGLDSAEKWFQVIMLVLVGGVLAWLFWKRKRILEKRFKQR